mgnify:CR=1 FL=1
MASKKAINNSSIQEHEIRAALLRFIELSAGDSVVREEFRIEQGGARIDVAKIGTRLVGYEIKSDIDTFVRFSNQIHAYNRVFDEIYLVCGQAHARLALNIIPSWWGIVLAEKTIDGITSLSVLRAAGNNPQQDPFSIASLLWRDEAAAILASEAKDVPKKASSNTLWDCIVKNLSFDKIKKSVTHALVSRESHKELAVKTM